MGLFKKIRNAKKMSLYLGMRFTLQKVFKRHCNESIKFLREIKRIGNF